MTNGEQTTGVRDEHYNLVSVLYHALQEGDVLQRYIDDAQQAGDDELKRFLSDVQEQNKQRATKAKSLLKERL